MIRAVVVLSLLAFATPAVAESRPSVGPANTGSANNRALGTPSPSAPLATPTPSRPSGTSSPSGMASPSGTASPSGSSPPRTSSPNPTPQQTPASGGSQPSEACKKFPNLC